MEGMEMLERLCAVDGEGSMGPEEGGGGVNVLGRGRPLFLAPTCLKVASDTIDTNRLTFLFVSGLFFIQTQSYRYFH